MLEIFDAEDETNSYYDETGETVGNAIAVPSSSGLIMFTDVDLDANGRAVVSIDLDQYRGASFVEDPDDRAGIFVKTDNGTSITLEAEAGAVVVGKTIRVTYL